MKTSNDNPGQGHRGGEEAGNDNHKSSRNQDTQKPKQPLKDEQEDDNFSPGEDDDYNARDFATD